MSFDGEMAVAARSTDGSEGMKEGDGMEWMGRTTRDLETKLFYWRDCELKDVE